MGRIRRLTIEGYRSVCNPIEINFPKRTPVILIGENNAGKSNIIRALDLILGEFWPGNHEPDDHEFFGRDRADGQITITVDLSGVADKYYGRQRTIDRLTWTHPPADGRTLRMTIGDGTESTYVSNAIREQCACILIDADRRLSYHLSHASKYTLLSKLTKRFHKALTADTAQADELQQSLDDLTARFHQVREFSAFEEELHRQLADLSGNLQYGLDIRFSAYDPSNYFRTLSVQPSEGDNVRSFDELGTGQEQILAICFAYAYASTFRSGDGLVLAIEEPEAHLHPLAQRWLGRKVKDLANQGVQVILTTHSPALLDIMNLEGIARVFRTEGTTCVVQRTTRELVKHCLAHGGKADESTILQFYAAGATDDILAGLFARKVILVEGVTEVHALPVYLKQVGMETARDGIAIIPVGGVNSLAKWWRFFTAFEIPCYLVLDQDSSDSKDRAGQRDALKTVGEPESEIDDLLRASNWIATDQFCIFPRDFESTLKDWFGETYMSLDQEARDLHGLGTRQSKPLRARYIASAINLAEFPDAREYFSQLAEHISRQGADASGIDEDESNPFDFDWDLDDVPFG